MYKKYGSLYRKYSIFIKRRFSFLLRKSSFFFRRRRQEDEKQISVSYRIQLVVNYTFSKSNPHHHHHLHHPNFQSASYQNRSKKLYKNITIFFIEMLVFMFLTRLRNSFGFLTECMRFVIDILLLPDLLFVQKIVYLIICLLLWWFDTICVFYQFFILFCQL